MTTLKEKINMTKLKQQTAELFNKKRRTVDPNFVKRMQYVGHLQKKVSEMFTSVQVFMKTSSGKSLYLDESWFKQRSRCVPIRWGKHCAYAIARALTSI